MAAPSEIESPEEIFAIDPVNIHTAGPRQAAAFPESTNPAGKLFLRKQAMEYHGVDDSGYPLILFFIENVRAVLEHTLYRIQDFQLHRRITLRALHQFIQCICRVGSAPGPGRRYTPASG